MTDTDNTTVVSEPVKEAKKDNANPRRGGRGEVGPHNIKGLFHSFQRREGRKAREVSLKEFAHQLAENGNDEERAIALKWIANKSGALKKKEREERQKNKGGTLSLIRQATKNAKRGKK